jgi:hypothetical protein
VHAVRRYCERIDRSATPEEAMRAIVSQLASARRVKERTNGLDLWRGPKPRRVRFFVQEGAQRIVTTIVEAHDGLAQWR